MTGCWLDFGYSYGWAGAKRMEKVVSGLRLQIIV
jgi:hypothetical protein